MTDENEEEVARRRNPRAMFIQGLGGGIPEPIRDILAGVAELHSRPIDNDALTDDRVKTLRSLSSYMSRPRDFQVGDIVRFKAGLNNSRIQNVAICRDFLDVPLRAGLERSASAHGSPYFNEPLDVVLGVFTEDGHFLEYYVDGRRLERVPDEELERA